MALTAQQIQQRDGKLSASRIGVLMRDDAQAILNLWKEMIGDPSYVAEDLSDVWPVQLGSCTEELHLNWIQKKAGYPITRRGEVVVMNDNPWACATLDGWDTSLNCPTECKHVGAYRKLDDVRAYYAPQLHWQMIVTGSKKAILSIIFGAAEPIQEEIPYSAIYADELWSRAVQFMHCVENLTPPVVLAPIAAPIPISEMIEKDMSSSNAWGEHAVDWIENKLAAKKFEKSAQELKALVDNNVCRAHGKGIEIKRSKSGSLTIKEKAE